MRITARHLFIASLLIASQNTLIASDDNCAQLMQTIPTLIQTSVGLAGATGIFLIGLHNTIQNLPARLAPAQEPLLGNDHNIQAQRTANPKLGISCLCMLAGMGLVALWANVQNTATSIP